MADRPPEKVNPPLATVEDLQALEERVADHILHCPVRDDAKELSERLQSIERAVDNGIKDVVTELHRDVREIRAMQMKIVFWVLGGVSGITAVSIFLNRML